MLAKRMAILGLSPTRYVLLSILSKKGETTLGRLWQEAGFIGQPAVSAIVDRMVKDGLLSYRKGVTQNDEDGRRSFVEIAPAGRNILRKVNE